MQKIILYYKFLPIQDPDLFRDQQFALAETLNLRGRVIISKHGINGTLGGGTRDLKKYIKQTRSLMPINNNEFKWSEGSREDFPRLSIKVREEIITFGAAKELKVDKNGVIGAGKKIKPEELHKLVDERGDEVVLFDGRNVHEAAVGKFKNAIVPEVRYTRDFINEIEKPKYQRIKNKPVVTYCTGGIRCEVLSMLMKNRGFKEVYQIDGGVAKYGEQYADEGMWEGSLYVFDKRMNVKFSDKAKDIGECTYCKKTTSRYINCANKACNDLILVCNYCNQKTYCPKDIKINSSKKVISK